MGLDGIPTRISHFFQDLPPNPTNRNKHRLGLQLSATQAEKVGLTKVPQPYFIDGPSIANCFDQADAFIANNFPGFHL